MESKAGSVLERYKNLNEEERVGGDPSKDGKDRRANMRGLIESMVNEEFSKDGDSAKKASDNFSKLAEKMDDKGVKNFMKHMDEAASKFKISEQFDGSGADGAKDADDDAEEKNKSGEDTADFGDKK